MTRSLRNDRLKLRRYERAADRMPPLDRQIFLGHVVDDLSYRQLAEKHRVTIAEVERSLCRCLGVLSRTLDEKDPWWWRFRP